MYGQEELKEWDQCLLMLGEAKVDEHGNISDTKDCNVMYMDKDGEDREINVLSSCCTTHCSERDFIHFCCTPYFFPAGRYVFPKQ